MANLTRTGNWKVSFSKISDAASSVKIQSCITSLSIIFMMACGHETEPGKSKDLVGGSSLKIVGGQRVSSNDPISASTVALVSIDGKAFCTGTVLSDFFVVTAAHCLEEYFDDKLYVAFGTLAKRGYFRWSNLREVESFKVHEDYTPSAMRTDEPWRAPADIALVQLKYKIPSGFHAVPFLRNGESVFLEEKLVLSGFGLTHFAYGESGQLYKLSTKLRREETQAKEIIYMGRDGYSACMGDSGGPAYVIRNGEFSLLGITSRGSLRCDSDGIYTDIRHYEEWLLDTARDLFYGV